MGPLFPKPDSKISFVGGPNSCAITSQGCAWIYENFFAAPEACADTAITINSTVTEAQAVENSISVSTANSTDPNLD
jgi:hypothetical protein